MKNYNLVSFVLFFFSTTFGFSIHGPPKFICSVPLTEINYTKVDSQIYNSKQKRIEFIENLPLIHATNILRDDFILKHGIVGQTKQGKLFEHILPRSSLHFSLGGLVRPHGDYRNNKKFKYTWEKNKFAVISKLLNIPNKIGAVHPEDSFLYGNYQIRKKVDYIVAPFSYFFEQGFELRTTGFYKYKGYRFFAYDSSAQSLRGSINRSLQKEGRFFLKEGESHSPYRVDRVSIEKKEFLEPFLKKYNLNYGWHRFNSNEEASWFYIFENTAGNFLSSMMEYEEKRQEGTLFKNFDQETKSAALSTHNLIVFQWASDKIRESRTYQQLNRDYKKRFKFWNLFVKKELALRKEKRELSFFDFISNNEGLPLSLFKKISSEKKYLNYLDITLESIRNSSKPYLIHSFNVPSNHTFFHIVDTFVLIPKPFLDEAVQEIQIRLREYIKSSEYLKNAEFLFNYTSVDSLFKDIKEKAIKHRENNFEVFFNDF